MGKERIPIQSEIETAEAGTSDDDKKVVKLGKQNELGYEDLILSINTSMSAGKVAFNLVNNCKDKKTTQKATATWPGIV